MGCNIQNCFSLMSLYPLLDFCKLCYNLFSDIWTSYFLGKNIWGSVVNIFDPLNIKNSTEITKIALNFVVS